MWKKEESNKDYSSRYNLVNNVLGWVAFAVAAITYLMTIEPTASLWDCGEFITTAFGLEVGHPPGAPLFMIMARFFSLFAPDPSKVAMMVNIMSALASAFTILFLFWTITHLAKKLAVKNNIVSQGNLVAIMGTGMVGALAYTFSDTFWFSAVEGEVYASSSLFTAVVFWAILKWENVAGEKYANRWIILIAYLMGLSIGVHLLNLLAIPAIVFVYYFKMFKPTRKGVITAFGLSVLILGVIMYGVIPGVIKVASWFELMFVNGFGLPFNSGVMVYAVALTTLVVWGLRYSIRHEKVILNTIITSFMVIIIGYSSFAMIVIRSSANPPMDENNPDNVFALLSYLNREQYGDRPLVYGPSYNAPAIDVKYTTPNYIQKKGKYVVASRKMEYEFDSRFMSVFPRMYSTKESHISDYKYWGKVGKGIPIHVDNNRGGETIYKPSFMSNLRFFFNYQVGHMYFRYFMWNFAGRQNDMQGYGGIRRGNWISGITPLDEWRLGNMDQLPQEVKHQKSRNKYYLFPLLLGLVGLLYQLNAGKKGKKDFWVVMLLFIFTGLAIVVYLNQYPQQPRERDYAYAGSFYAFAIWIGLGVMGLYQFIKKYVPGTLGAALASVICLVAVPAVMAQQNWDDHDRSGRYATLSYAQNYLNSCEANAILFTFGDNDTFPLWYAQEVEGIRRDIRIVNLSLLGGDWYINQMRRKAYDSDPVPMTLSASQIEPGVRDQIPVQNYYKSPVSLKDMIEFIGSDLKDTRLETQGGTFMDYMPGRKLYLPVDSAKVVANGTVKPSEANRIVKQLNWELKRNYIFKNDMMVYDIIAANNWERPIYFSVGMGKASFLGLEKYFRLEGATYRLVPIESKSRGLDYGYVDPNLLYDNMVNKFQWGNIKDPDVYMDQFHVITTNIMQYRNSFARLARSLNDKGEKEKAVKALDKCMVELPISKIPYEGILISFIQEYYRAGAIEKGNQLLKGMADHSYENLKYFLSLDDEYAQGLQQEQQREISIVQMLLGVSEMGGQTQLKEDIQSRIEMLYEPYMKKQ